MADETLRRPTRKPEVTQEALFDVDAYDEWRTHWWGMPEFVMGDARPAYKIVVNFMTLEDVAEFARRLGIKAGPRTDTVWFPPEQLDRPGEWEYAE